MGFYVNQAMGADELDAGRGESTDKAFASLQACLDYVAANYNLDKYDLTVNVASGYTSNTRINLPKYTTVTGSIFIRGADQDDVSKVKIGHIQLDYSVEYTLWDLTVKPGNAVNSWQAIYVTAGTLELRNVLVDVSETVVSAGNLNVIYTETSGLIRIYAVNSSLYKCGCTIKVSENIEANGIVLITASGGKILFSADIVIDGNVGVTSTIRASNVGVIQRALSGYENPGRAPNFTTTGTITGRRYSAETNGIIVSYSGGEDFFPGTVAGTMTSGGQYL